MPKSQYVDPGKAFEAGYIHFEDIPVCQYKKTLAEEKKIYTKDDFIRIYRDMAIIREFETMLNDVKTKSNYNGVEYNNPGPAHLSIGQEASAVGEAYSLDINDLSFGSHRSHGEILAKGLSSIHKLTEDVKRLEKMSIKLNNLERLQEENLEDVVGFQDIIYEHRQQCFLIPDFIYSLRKRNYQKSENMIAMDLINKKNS